MDTLEGLIQLSDSIVSVSKEQNARFNELLRQAFFYRRLGRFTFSYKEKIDLEFENQEVTSFAMQLYSEETVTRNLIEEKN